MRPLYDLSSVFAAQIRTAEEEAGRVYEPVIALVTDNADPSKLGRVKVKIPILSATDTTWWAPIIMLGAGKNRGWFFIPEVDDEVLVMFEHGDVNRPLVVGALWGGKDKPPDKNPGGNPRRVIRSRNGNKITFDDDPGVLQVILEDGTGKGKITLDAKNNKIIIEALKGDVCFQSPTGDTQIVAKSAELKAAKSIEIHAGSSMSWGAGSTMELKASTIAMTGSAGNLDCGKASSPAAPSADPQDVPDPYGS
ncbi:MAG: phage tail protein [Deltaproteobacteria bacterium]|nr:phage tail protein [Deltaproteobacteria bacterium]MDQ3299483.1 phage baseplate assembly protein V [Myxococcota bacterium]